MKINIYNTADRRNVDRRVIRRLVRRALQKEGRKLTTVNVIIADGRYMKHLNETYLNRKRTTSVISFNLGEVSEIYVSDELARDAYELNYYILHGLLHLLGHDHNNRRQSAIMNKKCMEYLKNE
jgi:rRNA maturation RNase YbeY